MAPNRRRRRSKNVPPGGYRRDAALDAMRDMGFKDELIETTVDELLEVYDGGWLFREDSSYCVLRETLLAKSNPTTEPGNPVKERDFDLANRGAVDTENVEWAITIQPSPQRRRVHQEQSKVVSSSDEGGPVGVILPDSELKGSNASVVERAATVPGSEGNATKLFSLGGVELQCDKSPGGNELACPLPSQDGESSGSE